MSQIKIGYQQYKVEEVESVNKFEPRKGEIDIYNRKIRIDKDMTKEDKQETLIHEILHGLEDFMGFQLEEAEIRKLGCGLAMVLMDNPDLIKDLNERS